VGASWFRVDGWADRQTDVQMVTVKLMVMFGTFSHILELHM